MFVISNEKWREKQQICQVTFIYSAFHTIQIVSKLLYSKEIGNYSSAHTFTCLMKSRCVRWQDGQSKFGENNVLLITGLKGLVHF